MLQGVSKTLYLLIAGSNSTIGLIFRCSLLSLLVRWSISLELNRDSFAVTLKGRKWFLFLDQAIDPWIVRILYIG
jgi:hypothetical protein